MGLDRPTNPAPALQQIGSYQKPASMKSAPGAVWMKLSWVGLIRWMAVLGMAIRLIRLSLLQLSIRIFRLTRTKKERRAPIDGPVPFFRYAFSVGL